MAKKVNYVVNYSRQHVSQIYDFGYLPSDVRFRKAGDSDVKECLVTFVDADVDHFKVKSRRLDICNIEFLKVKLRYTDSHSMCFFESRVQRCYNIPYS